MSRNKCPYDTVDDQKEDTYAVTPLFQLVAGAGMTPQVSQTSFEEASGAMLIPFGFTVRRSTQTLNTTVINSRPQCALKEIPEELHHIFKGLNVPVKLTCISSKTAAKGAVGPLVCARARISVEKVHTQERLNSQSTSSRPPKAHHEY